MNISNPSASSVPAPSKWTPARKLLAGIAAGSLLVAAGLWAQSIGGESLTPDSRLTTGQAFIPQPHFGSVDEGLVRTVFLAGSEAQAATMRANLNEADSIRNQQGLAPMLDDVLVAATQADADRLTGLIEEGNRILAAVGRPYRVVDLRAG